MKTVKIIGATMLIITVIVLVFAWVQPSRGHVEKSIVIQAPVSAVFAEVNSLQNFTLWSPWAKMDPDAKYAYEGPVSGAGAKMTWDGKNMGKGSQWIIESTPDEHVKNGIAFQSFNGTFYSQYTLRPQASGTLLTWTYDGINEGFKGKLTWLFMKGALATQYTEGLTDLKNLIEKKTSPSANPNP